MLQIKFIDFDDRDFLRVRWTDCNVRRFKIANDAFHTYYKTALENQVEQTIKKVMERRKEESPEIPTSIELPAQSNVNTTKRNKKAKT